MTTTAIHPQKLHRVRGELALATAVVIDSLGVVLMLDSGAGISSISSLPYAFSLVFPALSLGTWTYLFQAVLVLSLMLMRRRFVPSYLLSFVVGFFFSEMLDVYKAVVGMPSGMVACVAYFAASYLLICIGIALSNRCGLPIIPTDLFPRELAVITRLPYSRIKIGFDASCLAVTAFLTVVFLGRLDGLGIGTVLAALTMGKVIGWVGEILDRHVVFVTGYRAKS